MQTIDEDDMLEILLTDAECFEKAKTEIEYTLRLLLDMVCQNCQYMLGLFDSGAISTHFEVLEYLTKKGILVRHKNHSHPDGFMYTLK